MKKSNLYLIIIFLFIGCKSEENTNSFKGEFRGYWADTNWQYKFYSNNEFEFKSEGHYGFIESKGTFKKIKDSLFLTPNNSSLVNDGVVNSLFLIDGDSCIIDYNLKYDYCKTRDWSYERAIKYPQIKTDDLKLISELEFMLQNTLESEEVKNQVKDTTQSLIIEEYFKLDIEYKNQIKVFGKPVIFKSKEEIESEKIENYVQIEDINLNVDFTNIYLNIIPTLPGKKILAYFDKEGGKWKRKKL